MASGSCPVLPADATFSYLDEGAANIVYRIHVRYPTPETTELEEYGEGTPPPTEIEVREGKPTADELAVFDNKLLRLRKNLPTTAPCVIAQESWLRLIVPLFQQDQIVNQCLVQLPSAKVIEHLNKELEGRGKYEYPMKGSSPSWQSLRLTKFHGVYLADDEYGLLVEDMSPGGGQELIQFKPKWLTQSPSAPPNSKRCRQCAKVARMNAENTRTGSRPQKSFCPLDLVSSNPNSILKSAQIILEPSNPPEVLRFAHWLETTPLLLHLRDQQQALDPKGVFEADPNHEMFRAAMTLRDCTVFVRLTTEDGQVDGMEARLGDLDLKSGDKGGYWRETERILIDEGWYTGTERGEDRQPLTCSLSRE